MKHRLFPIGSFAGYMLIDFATIAFSIMASYKFYRVMGFGQNVYYAKLGIIPCGSGNDFAAGLGLNSIADGVEAVVDGKI